MEKVSVLAITKNGISIGAKLKEIFPDWNVYAPSKFSNDKEIIWYSEPTSEKRLQNFGFNILVNC